MKKSTLILLGFISITPVYSQPGILVNPYSSFDGAQSSPSYINYLLQPIQTLYNTETHVSYTGEYEVDLQKHQWWSFISNHVVTYDFEVVGFPFTMDCAFQISSCADCNSFV